MNFQEAFEIWLSKAQAIVDSNKWTKDYPRERTLLKIMEGRRYLRIVLDTSAYCFIDKTNGNVLKANSWKQPDHRIRGNIFSENVGVTEYGAVYFYR